MRPLLTPVVALLAGCTLILEPAPVSVCTEDAQCLAASEAAGYPSTCLKLFCNEGSCVEYDEGDESCDGWDNDCDGIIDEPSASGEAAWREGRVMAEGVPERSIIRYGSWDQRAVATWSTGSAGSHVTLLRDNVSTPESMSFWTSKTEAMRDSGESDIDLVEGCRTADGGWGLCDFVEVASAPTPQHEILAVVSSIGCGEGRLMLGLTPPVEELGGVPVVIRGGGPDTDSNSFLGIDVGSAGPCSGVSRPTCSGSGEGCGAARPALVAIDEGFVDSDAFQQHAAQAGVAWLGADVARAHCGGQLAPVETLVAHLLRRSRGRAFFWVTASNEGVPATLGETRGGGAPAVVRWRRRGWFVAYGNASDDLAMAWVPAQPQPPEFDSGLPIPPIEGLVDLGSVSVGGSPDHVALAIGSTRAAGLEVGATWLEGCGQAEQRIRFQRLLIQAEGTTPTAVVADGDAVTLERSSSTLGPPTIAFSDEGVVIPGYSRGGATADESNDGGWTVLWTSGDDRDGDGRVDAASEIHGARVAELDGAPVGDIGRFGTPASDSPQMYGEGRFVHRQRDTGAILGGTAICSP